MLSFFVKREWMICEKPINRIREALDNRYRFLEERRDRGKKWIHIRLSLQRAWENMR